MINKWVTILFLCLIIASCKGKMDMLNEQDKSIVQNPSGQILDSSISSNPENSEVIVRDYEEVLNKAIIKLKENKMDTQTIIQVIPTSQSEYEIWYGLTDDEKTEKFFYRLGEDFIKYSDNDIAFKCFLNVAEFVDGEYAESYFDDIEFLIKKRKQSFCIIFLSLTEGSKKRLIEYEAICKPVR